MSRRNTSPAGLWLTLKRSAGSGNRLVRLHRIPPFDGKNRRMGRPQLSAGQECATRLGMTGSGWVRGSLHLLIKKALALENMRHIFSNARLAGFGLLGSGKMIDVGSLPSGRQRFKGSPEVR